MTTRKSNTITKMAIENYHTTLNNCVVVMNHECSFPENRIPYIYIYIHNIYIYIVDHMFPFQKAILPVYRIHWHFLLERNPFFHPMICFSILESSVSPSKSQVFLQSRSFPIQSQFLSIFRKKIPWFPGFPRLFRAKSPVFCRTGGRRPRGPLDRSPAAATPGPV